ncbi:MAG: Holliday junction resolvase RuvX [Planctomycetota bacterium]
MRILALDPGTVRIGVAVSDALGMIAHGRPHVPAADPGKALREIERIAREEEVSEVVVGFPLQMDGTEGIAAAKVRSFAETLRARLGGLPVTLRDERLTTARAVRALDEAGASRRVRRESTDRIAAQLLLQGLLDERRAGAALS